MANKFELDYGHGVVKRSLMEIPSKLLEGAEDGLFEAAHLMQGFAQIYVRVDTGSLRDSIRVERGGKARGVVKVRAGGYVTNPKTGKVVDYAVIVELKYPYMKPAWEQVRPQVESIIRRKCIDQLKTIQDIRFP